MTVGWSISAQQGGWLEGARSCLTSSSINNSPQTTALVCSHLYYHACPSPTSSSSSLSLFPSFPWPGPCAPSASTVLARALHSMNCAENDLEGLLLGQRRRHARHEQADFSEGASVSTSVIDVQAIIPAGGPMRCGRRSPSMLPTAISCVV